MKKILLLTVILLIISGMSINSFAYTETETKEVFLDRDQLRKNIWDEYKKLDEFERHFAENPKDAEAMIETIVDSYLQSMDRSNLITPKGGQGNIAYINFPRFKQKNGYYCGPSSALTAIYGMGKAGSVSGTTYNVKQDTLANNMGTQKGIGTYVYRMRNELNKYSTEQYNYYYQPTKNNMFGIIFGSLLSDNAPILHADTQYFSYYNGYSTGHYVTVVFHNASFGDNEIGGMAVMDNNRNDSYYGAKDISLNEAYNAIRGRYLIGVSL